MKKLLAPVVLAVAGALAAPAVAATAAAPAAVKAVPPMQATRNTITLANIAGGSRIGREGCSPKDWGMSRTCKRIVTQHAHTAHIGYRRWHA